MLSEALRKSSDSVRGLTGEPTKVEAFFDSLKAQWSGKYCYQCYGEDYMSLLQAPCIRYVSRSGNNIYINLCRNNSINVNVTENPEEVYQGLREAMRVSQQH